jgi:Tfp pilus assembly protein PilF
MSVGAVTPACAQIKHFEITADERFLLCAREVLGKPVLEIMSVSAPCPDTSENLKKSLQKQGVSIFEQSDFIYLWPSTDFSPKSGMKWRHVSIDLDPRDDFAATPGCRKLTSDEMDDITDRVLQEVRMVSVDVTYLHPEPGTDTVSAPLIVSMGACHFKPNTESIVGQLVGEGGNHRLFFGEIKDGKPVVLWDSPPVDGWIERLQDMDGDGIPEILVTNRSGRQNAECLTVYDINGSDLTRHADADGAGCVIGLENEFEKRPDGKMDILAWSPNEASTEGHPYRYTLVNGHYVLQKSASQQQQPKAADHASDALNEQGMQFMKEKNYEMASIKFMEACLNTKSALFTNNAGFAYYKMEKFEESVTWFKKSIEIAPKRAVAYLNLGDAFVKLNRNSEARQAYNKYLELAPNSNSAPDVKKKLDALPPSP